MENGPHNIAQGKLYLVDSARSDHNIVVLGAQILDDLDLLRDHFGEALLHSILWRGAHREGTHTNSRPSNRTNGTCEEHNVARGEEEN
jgi:hypothetical protein